MFVVTNSLVAVPYVRLALAVWNPVSFGIAVVLEINTVSNINL
jgi:hypothetical protein